MALPRRESCRPALPGNRRLPNWSGPGNSEHWSGKNRGIDDAVGAVTVHGTIGLYGVVMLGIWGSGYPALQGAAGEVPTISLMGQIIGALVFFLCGFVPGYIVSLILKVLGMLRVPEGAELAGMDIVKVPASGYPEWGGDAPVTPAHPAE